MRKSKLFAGFLMTLILAACQPVVLTPAVAPAIIQATGTATNEPITATLPPATPESALSLAPTGLSAATPWPTPTQGLAPLGGSEEVLFSVEERSGEEYLAKGVYLLNQVSGQLTELFGEGYQLQALSPDGHWILVNQEANLYLAGRYGTQPVLLSETFFNMGTVAARWTNDSGTLLWIEQAETGTRLMSAAPLGENFHLAPEKFQGNPVALFSSPDIHNIVWAQGECTTFAVCSRDIWVGDLEADMLAHWETMYNPVPNAAGIRIAHLIQDAAGSHLTIGDGIVTSAQQILDLEDDIPADYAWLPDGKTLVALGLIRSDYTGKSFGNHVITFTGKDWSPEVLGEVSGLNARLSVSPDGKAIAVTATEADDSSYHLGLRVFKLAEKQLISFDEQINFSSANYLYVPQVIWVP
ncbi:MAG: hypothetical protein CVU39_08140 [Chloroflexi bacterium HGW-Chloroflexi-10]|nr:MAG: hypothetical protein CVU39_08140 [Chloroflexi bacterium HGW-Chloroflexi-10]